MVRPAGPPSQTLGSRKNVGIYFETQFFPKIYGARLLISDLYGCALFCVQQNLWSFPQISGAQRFKSVRGFRVIAPRKKEEGFGGYLG